MVTQPAGKKHLRIISTVLLALVTFLTPVALYTNWAAATVGDKEQFVETLGPLASNFEVQKSLSVALDDLIDSIDVERALEEFLPPALAPASGLLASGVKSGLNTLADRFIYSEQFGVVWTRIAEAFHTELIGVLEGEETGFVRDGDGGLFITIEPLREALLERLSDSPAFGLVAPRIENADLPTVQLMNDQQLRFMTFVWDTSTLVGVIIWPVIFLAGIGGVLLRGSLWRGGVYLGAAVVSGSAITLLSVVITRARLEDELAEGIFGRAIGEIFAHITGALQQSSYTAFWVGVTIMVAFGGAALLAKFRPDVVETMVGGARTLMAQSVSSINRDQAPPTPQATTPVEKQPVSFTPPVAQKPAAKKPTAKKPAAKKTTTAQPATKKTVAKKPAAKKPTAKKPAGS